MREERRCKPFETHTFIYTRLYQVVQSYEVNNFNEGGLKGTHDSLGIQSSTHIAIVLAELGIK